MSSNFYDNQTNKMAFLANKVKLGFDNKNISKKARNKKKKMWQKNEKEKVEEKDDGKTQATVNATESNATPKKITGQKQGQFDISKVTY